MSKYIGRLVNVGLARETVRGTAVTAAQWFPKSSVAFFDKAPRLLSKLSYGSIGDGNLSPTLMKFAEGKLESDVNDKGLGYFLYALLGSCNSSGPSDSAYTHTFTLANTNQHTALTITIQDPDRTDQFPLAMLDALELEVVPDDVIKLSADFKSRPGRQVANATPTYIASNKFLGRHANIKIATLASGLAAATAISVKKLTVKFNKNTVLNNILGTVHPDDIINTKFEITGDIELDLEDQTYRDYMLDASYKAMRIDFLNGDVLIGTTSQPRFTLDLSRVMFESWEPTRANDDIVTQKISFRALYDITNSNIINSCTLINAVTSY